MRKQFTIFLILVFIFGLTPVDFSNAENLTDRLKGKILLQVESNGEAWYINPDNSNRYYLGRPADAFSVMRELGLGISNKDFDSFNNVAPKRLSGKILLKVEDSGKAYYVNPDNLNMHFLGRPADAFQIMRELGLGITNNDLNAIGIFDKYADKDEVVKFCLEQPFELQGKCINQQAIDKKNYEICNKIYDLGHNQDLAEIEIAYCIREVAIATDNQFICVKIDNQCDKLNNQNTKNVCYNEKNVCYRELATKLNDYFLCDQINIIVENDSIYKDGCYYTIGTNQKNLNACKKIENSALKDSCTNTALK